MEGNDYLKHFDKIFNTQTLKNIKLDNMVLLKELYVLLEEYLSRSNNESSNIRRKSIKLYDELKSTLTDEQIELLDNIFDLNNEEMSKEQEQIFIFGYIIAKELDNESNIKLINE